MNNIKELYDKDFYGWIATNVELLKFGKFKSIDIDNIIEELETLRRLIVLIDKTIQFTPNNEEEEEKDNV